MLSVARNNAFKIFQNNRKWNLLLRNLSQQELLPWVTIDKEGRKAEVIIPGYSYGDLDRVGNVNIWKVTHLCEAARIALLARGNPTPPALVDALKVIPNKLLVLGAARYEISEAFYDRRHYYNPIRHEYTIAHFGQTSYQKHGEAYSTVTGDLPYQDSIFCIIIDKDSRRPAPLDNELKMQIFGANSLRPMGRPLEPVRTLAKPADCMTRQARLEWSHVDYYYHTNQSQYVKLVCDAAAVFAMQNGFKSIRGDIAKRRIRMIEMAYKGETHPGDVLDIYAWEIEREGEGDTEAAAGGVDTRGPTLGFQIDKAGKTVYQCKIELV